MNAITEAVIHTPWWVYLLLFVLIRIGIKAAKTRVVSLKKLLIAPGIFTWMSVHGLVMEFGLNPTSFFIWSAAIVAGIGLGFWQTVHWKIRVDAKKGLFELPGTWSLLWYVLIIFAFKYAIGYSLGVHAAFSKTLTFEVISLGVSGVFTGVFLGRFIRYVLLLRGPSVDLSEAQS